jgi:hypothetical protein
MRTKINPKPNQVWYFPKRNDLIWVNASCNNMVLISTDANGCFWVPLFNFANFEYVGEV